LEMLGLDPFPEKTYLNPVITGKVEHKEFTVENLHFQSRPRLYVTANLYIPKDMEKPAPTILYVCGHGPSKKNGISYGNKVTYQHHAAWFARHGYVVDKERFGVTGRSGGGAYSWWISTIDDRIKVAVPVAGITDLQNHVIDGCVEGHCDCMYFVNTYRWDYLQLPALVAPRPLLISNTDKDSIFPLDGVMRTYLKTMKIYDLYNARDKLGLHICEGPHKDTQQLRIHAFVWFNRFLKNDNSLIDKPAVPFFEPEQLKVFNKLPADEINTTIHESFVPKAPPPPVPQSVEEWKKQRDAWTKALQEKVFRGWPSESQAGPLNIEPAFSAKREGIRFSAYEFTSQPHVRLRLYVLGPEDNGKVQSAALTVLDDHLWPKFLAAMSVAFAKELTDQKLAEPDSAAFGRIRKTINSEHRAIAFFAPRGIGPSAWNPDERKQTQIRRRFMLLGQTADSMRVWDVRRAIQALRSIDSLRNAPLTLQGQDKTAGIALYAAIFDDNIETLNLWHPPHSHRQGPIFLNVLRYLDIPQAVAMAAEHTEVRLYRENDFSVQFPKAVAEKLRWPKKQLQELAPRDDQDIFAASNKGS